MIIKSWKHLRIAHKGENEDKEYVKIAFSLEQDVQDCKSYIERLFSKNPAVIKYSPIIVRVLNGSGFFIIKDLEIDPNTKVGDFVVYAMSTFKSKLAQGFSSFGERYKDMSFREKGKNGNER